MSVAKNFPALRHTAVILECHIRISRSDQSAILIMWQTAVRIIIESRVLHHIQSFARLSERTQRRGKWGALLFLWDLGRVLDWGTYDWHLKSSEGSWERSYTGLCRVATGLFCGKIPNIQPCAMGNWEKNQTIIYQLDSQSGNNLHYCHLTAKRKL